MTPCLFPLPSFSFPLALPFTERTTFLPFYLVPRQLSPPHFFPQLHKPAADGCPALPPASSTGLAPCPALPAAGKLSRAAAPNRQSVSLLPVACPSGLLETCPPLAAQVVSPAFLPTDSLAMPVFRPHHHTIRHLGSGRAPQSPHSDAFTILLVPFCSQGSLSMLGGGTEGCPGPVLAVPVARLPRVARGLLELLRGVVVSRLASCHILFSSLDKCNLLPLLLV